MHIFLRYDVHNKPISIEMRVLRGMEKQNLNGGKMIKTLRCAAIFGLMGFTLPVSYASDNKPELLKVQSLSPKFSGNGLPSSQSPQKSRLSAGSSSGGSTGCAVSTASKIRAAALLEEMELMVGTMSKTSGAIFSYLGNENSMFGAFDIESAYRSQSARPVSAGAPERSPSVTSVSYKKWALGPRATEPSACIPNIQRF